MKVALDVDLSFLADELAIVPGVEPVILPSPDNMAGSVPVDVLLCTAVGGPHLPEILDYCHGLKWIHILGTGVDAFPLELVSDKIITCSRGATATPIAEWALAMMLGFEKQLPERWLGKPPEAWYIADLGTLEGKTLGIVGYGAIGQAIAKRALAFDMTVIAKVRTHRESPNPNVRFEADLDALLAESDHVVLALPATPESQNLINAKTLKLMKPGAHLVNISRADLIDQDALKDSLDVGHLGRASLDVVAPEPLPDGHWMYAHPRIALSAHISWSSPTSHARIIAPFFENIAAFLKDEPLQGVVDTSAGY